MQTDQKCSKELCTVPVRCPGTLALLSEADSKHLPTYKQPTCPSSRKADFLVKCLHKGKFWWCTDIRVWITASQPMLTERKALSSL